MRKKKQRAEYKTESDFILLVEEKFDVLNGLLCEGIINQLSLLDLRSNGDEVDKHACDMLIII